MLIKVQKQTEETIEVKTPCWLVNSIGFYAHITEGGDLIQVFGGTVSLGDASQPSTQREIARVTQEYFSCSEEQFKEALDKRLFKLEETYTRA